MNTIKKYNSGFWNPLHELEHLQDEMNKLFDFSLIRRPAQGGDFLAGLWSPAVDIRDSKDKLIVKADIPGIEKDDLKVTVENGVLIIQGERRFQQEEKKDDFIRTERSYGAFQRALQLPTAVDANKIQATCKNGVLELVLPKTEEAKPKQIQIDVK